VRGAQARGDVHRLRDDLAGREVSRVAHLASRAENAAHRAADLAADARGHAPRETHQHGLDFFLVASVSRYCA